MLALGGRSTAGVAVDIEKMRRRLGRRQGVRLVIDLGGHRALPATAVEELVATFLQVRDSAGRLVVVAVPALASQISLAYPVGIPFAASQAVALALAGHSVPRLTARHDVSRRRLTVRLVGRLDGATLQVAEEQLARATAFAESGRSVVVDLSRLSHVDISGLREIVAVTIRCRLAGADAWVVGVRPRTMRLFGRLEHYELVEDVLRAPQNERAVLGWPAIVGIQRRARAVFPVS
ncbi:STAS domain-containing protein [Solirubrobacter taibaiensis]|nr:STAS domain-containing protein [Solirubrobacter taibaiensis]